MYWPRAHPATEQPCLRAAPDSSLKDSLCDHLESLLWKLELTTDLPNVFSQKAQGFHSEIEDFLLELTRMETQLSASKPTGGLPETAREQLDTHMVIHFLKLIIGIPCSVAPF